MNLNDLVKIIEATPVVQAIELEASEKRTAIERLIPIALDEVVYRYDWDFACDIADDTTTATQVYTLQGNKDDCRDIINVRYGTDDDGFRLLDKLRPVDMDAMLSDRTVTGIAWWTPHGRTAGGFPKIKIYNATEADKTLRYRYRRNNLTVASFPDGFAFVLVSGVLKRLAPAHTTLFEHDLGSMIDRYQQAGGEDNPVQLDPVITARNNERATLYGYS